jgi:hypothetical protein
LRREQLGYTLEHIVQKGGTNMSLLKIFLLAGGISFALASGASAQETHTIIPEGSAVIIHPKVPGKTIKVGKVGHQHFTTKGRELPAGAAIYRTGGKLYIYEPPANSTDQEFMDQAKGWVE